MSRELLQQALDQLRRTRWASNCEAGYLNDPVIAALEAELAKPDQDAVAVWELQEGGWDTIADADWMETLPIGTKLYAIEEVTK